ncbi:hypothetical protein DFH08DRAFT_962570 [Mycena albidolilacea]|uniref:FAD-binding domain-containing protein n=1 Tax=Mycena albidolilacea TaxID=1033008 RepID=A0AAD6ZXC0_9AGAR|nr:hypothetical protein DFH08DRAFT_962570 [Mycena albidolilacea]
MQQYELPSSTVPKPGICMERRTARPTYGNGARLGQDILEDILRSHLAKHGVSVDVGKALVAIEQDSDSLTATVCIQNDGKPIDEKETIVGEFLLGADGAQALTFQGETKDTGSMDGLSSKIWHVWGKPEQFTIMVRPLSPTGKKYGVGIMGQKFDPSGLDTPEKAIEFIHTETGRTKLQFGAFAWRPRNELRLFKTPLSNFAWKPALVLKGRSPASLLSSPNTERLPVIAHMLHATAALSTYAVAKEKPIEAPGTSGWLRWKNNALRLYDVNYRSSEIIVEERDTQPLDSDPEDVIARAYSGPGMRIWKLCGPGIEHQMLRGSLERTE